MRRISGELGEENERALPRGPVRRSDALGLGWLILATAVGALAVSPAMAAPDASSGIEFFEKRIRPVLVERCFQCHSAQEGKRKGGLWLDSKAGVLAGGDGGPVIVPGQPGESRLIQAVTYSNVDLQMPPKGKLSDEQVADFVAWVQLGAPWPEGGSHGLVVSHDGFDLQERRRRHWAWKPISWPPVPSVNAQGWSRNPVDAFVLATLERNQLPPAPAAEPATLWRRIHLDLIGLPPELGDDSYEVTEAADRAYERLVDQLLASPHFGERWARHWLDLVRYAETLGHEFDYLNPNAWRYRDYVIRAFNADVPYKQFVLEHVAGDLLEVPRRHPQEGFNESVIGTTFYWLGQRDHSPVDVRQHQAELIDNQIDVLSKTFLGLTVACARCHDHKFDAISTSDYYSLYGVFSSSRYSQSTVNPPMPISAVVQQLAELRGNLRHAVSRLWSSQAADSAQYLVAAEELRGCSGSEPEPDQIDATAREYNLDPMRFEQWVTALGNASAAGHPLFAWAEWTQSKAAATPDANARWQAVISSSEAVTNSRVSNRVDQLFADFTSADAGLCGWSPEGEVFGSGPAPLGEFMTGGLKRPIERILEAPALHSGVISRRLQGALRSPTFTITNRYIHVWAAGRDARINVPVENFTMIRDPIYGGLKRVLSDDQFQWITIDVGMWQDLRAYLEFSDISTPDPGDDRKNGFGPNGYIAVGRVLFSDHSAPPAESSTGAIARALGPTVPASSQELAGRYQQAILEAVRAWSSDSSVGMTAEQARLLNTLVQYGLLDATASEDVLRLAAAYTRAEAAIPDPVRVPAMVDGTGLEERVFIRGNHRMPGQPAPRRFLEAIAGPEQGPFRSGSGRLELAQAMVEDTNPFLARVIVNRIWQHLFGRGLVATPDDFGELGQAPTHPELLDWLANWFRTDGHWSIKKLIRLLVMSNTYRMSSRPEDQLAEKKDPDNLLWHRMPVRRLQGETIRDGILAISGRLDPALFGPPVPIHLTEFMDGRGRPGTSGPLDGAGRRSIYVEVRRNFASPMMRAFDMPVPFTTIGRRTVSNVPAQSLILMNDPFIAGEAARWAKRVLAEHGSSPEQRIQAMYRAAFHRSPSSSELAVAISFLAQQADTYGLATPDRLDDLTIWSDLCHVLFNVKEFVFVN